eukprot:CAMPEP_0117674530 /NCGR_PEP_ID=MMETSP0804-20121206/15093_1 /TAXON_ID=1074897 /ORGANISM="Tetraselmis astigmatica, Strain CCMP880" /LENGTH=75 /DNA_ID=CAMNT_0005483417 /DNA_START=38 /DNA_END=265 /DNA_ORIENTATION=-
MPGVPTPPQAERQGSAPLTAEQFQLWKEQRDQQAAQERRQRAAQRTADIHAGTVPLDDLTGKELFDHHPELFSSY